MAIIYIEGKKYKVNESDNLLKVCLSFGFNIPYFCWHPALGSVGACRQCAVKQYHNSNDVTGHIVMSCMTPVMHGNIISITDNESKEFRKRIIELLMINHPHDCPICEEGGSCHLQDMTVMTEHRIRRYRFTKRTHYSQYLGPFISHEMNRCITCYRCVRYYNDYADGKDFGVYGIHDNIYFGRIKDGTLENEFSGNLIEICPTGVFTDKTHTQRYNRKWDMQFAPNICQQCCIGCNTSIGERYGELRRIDNRYNWSINHYFLCDRGRFGYGYANLKTRPKKPFQRRGSDWITLNREQAIQGAVDALRSIRKMIGIGSPRASIESNFALRELVGIENFYTGMSSTEQDILMLILNILRNSGVYTPSLHEIENYDAILILGEDLTQTGARIALAVRQAIKNKIYKIAELHKIPNWDTASVMNVGQYAKYPLFITNVDQTGLDDIATWNYYAPVNDQARLGFAIANAIDDTAPHVNDIDIILKNKINAIAQAMINSNQPLIISGSHSGSKTLITAAANIARALKKYNNKVGISFVSADANSMGVAMIGGKSIDDALSQIEQGIVKGVIVMENDLYRHASKTRIDNALTNIDQLIVIDHIYSSIQDKANLILPAANFAESSGTLVNHEGRAQRFFQVYDPSYYDKNIIILSSWRWLHALHTTYLNNQISWTKLDHIIDAVSQKLPQLAGIKQAAPNSEFRIHGQKIARQPICYSGRTAILSNITVHEPRTPYDTDTMFTFSMEGNHSLQAPHKNIAFAWAPGWNSSQAWNKFQNRVGDHLHCGDPGVRLLQTSNGPLKWFDYIPIAFKFISKNNWYIAPYWHLFGSEELSQLSEVIKQRMPKLYVIVSKKDAIRLNIDNKTTALAFNCADQELCLPVKFSDKLSSGQLGLPLGFPGIPPIFAGLCANNLRMVIV